jgi:predicted alpha/beta-hydrolase family hydrolase
MPTETEKLSVSVNENDSVTALLYAAAKQVRAGFTALLGHGAGASQDSGFMRMFATGLASRGLDVMTFNFIYMEQGRSVPDQKGKLESCFRAVIDAARQASKTEAQPFAHRWEVDGWAHRFAGGGRRVAGQRTTRRSHNWSGLPWLPAASSRRSGKASRRTSRAHSQADVFVQGTRDALGTPEEIQPFIKGFKPAAKIHTIEGGDHSFKAPKKFGLPQEEIYDTAMNEIVRWAGVFKPQKRHKSHKTRSTVPKLVRRLLCLVSFGGFLWLNLHRLVKPGGHVVMEADVYGGGYSFVCAGVRR